MSFLYFERIASIAIYLIVIVRILGSKKILIYSESLDSATEMSDINLIIPATPVPTQESLAEMSGSKETAPQSETIQEVEEDAHNSTFIVVKADGRKVSGR